MGRFTGRETKTAEDTEDAEDFVGFSGSNSDVGVGNEAVFFCLGFVAESGSVPGVGTEADFLAGFTFLFSSASPASSALLV